MGRRGSRSVIFGQRKNSSRSSRQHRLAPEQLESRLLLTQFAVNGTILWTDALGNTHPVPMVTVELHERDILSTVIGTAQTDAAGRYSFSVNYDDGIAQGNPDIFVRALTRSPVADVKPSTVGATTYFIDTGNVDEVPAGSTQTLNITAPNNTNAGKAFSVHHAFVVMGQYASTLAGAMPAQIPVYYDHTITGSFFRPGDPSISIRGTAWNEWDPISHEYGHYFQAAQQFVQTVGGAHGFYDNLSSTKGGKLNGTQMAWSEGWVTFFGTSGQQLMGTAGLNIPNVGDTNYTSWGGSTNYSLETETGTGEDNEMSVQTALWDVFDTGGDGQDDSQVGDQTMFNLFKGGPVLTIGQAWEALAAGKSAADRARLGAVFAQNNIAPDLIAPANNASFGEAAPTFQWEKNGAGAAYSLNDFRIRFYSADFGRIVFEKELGDTNTFTPSAAEWNTIRGGDAVVNWVVEGRNTSNPSSPGGSLGYYWSGARKLGSVSIIFAIDDTGSMSEEIDGVKAALQQFINTVESSLGPTDPRPIIQLLTFKDDVTVRITTSDLTALRAEVGALYASGGGDWPEFSAQALALAAENISGGGTILLATDAPSQPGVDMGAVIAKLRAKGATVNTILSASDSDEGSSSEAGAPSGPMPDERLVTLGGSLSGGAGTEPGGPDGGFEPPQNAITVATQTALDDHGDTRDTATPLLVNSGWLLGSIGRNADYADVFALSLTAGTRYTFIDRGVGDDYLYADMKLTDASGTQLGYAYSAGSIQYVPTTSGTYYLEINYGYGTELYMVKATDDPIAGATSATELFSTASALTGGTFVLADDVNYGSSDAFQAAAYNVMASTLGATVLTANPGSVPQGQTVAVTLTGRKTNWRTGSTSVAFSDPKLAVQSVTVNSPTSLTVIVQVASDLTTGRYDATVTTALGSSTETAKGTSVLNVTSATTDPIITSITPAYLTIGSTVDLTVRGANVAWASDAVVTLGSGIEVESVTVVSPTQLTVRAKVNPAAGIGYRTATVTQGDTTAQLSRALFVQIASVGIPTVTGISPASTGVGRESTITVTGENTHFAAGTTTASFGDGVEVLGVVVNSPTEAVVTIRTAADANVGFRNVVMTSGSETAVLLQGLFVGPTASGNVKATFKGTTLTLKGDTEGNAVQITKNGEGQFVVTGLYGATVNGSIDAFVVTGTVKNISVDMGAGADTVVFSNATLPGNLSVQLGVDSDSLTLDGVTVGGIASVKNTKDNATDRLQVTGSTFSKSLSLDGGGGDDEIVVSNSSFTRTLTILGGLGADEVLTQSVNAAAISMNLGKDTNANAVQVLQTQTTGALTITSYGGEDSVSIRNSAIGRNLTVSTGEGNDQVQIRDAEVHGSLKFGTAGGDDTVLIDTTEVTASASVLAGKGVDAVRIGQGSSSAFGVHAAKLTVDTSADADTVQISGAAVTGLTKVNASSGSNSVTVSSSVFSDLQILFGTGDDLFDATGGDVLVAKKTTLTGGSGTNTASGLDAATNAWGTLKTSGF